MEKVNEYNPYENKSCNEVPLSDEKFEKETAKFYKEVEMNKARIQRNLLRYFGGNK